MYQSPVKPLSMTEAIDELKTPLLANKLILFAGSGVSVQNPSNLPTWDGLMTEFIAFCSDQIVPFLPPAFQDDFNHLLKDANKNKQNYPSWVASALKEQLKKIQSTTPLNAEDAFESWIIDLFSGRRFNDNHKFIINTKYQHILTSNYDDLLEKASQDSGFGLHLNSYSYNETKKIASAFYERETSIVHVHGKFKGIPLDKIVFTLEDYRRIKNDYPGFRLALSNLFASYSILFVGYGSSDPHLEDFIEEIGHYFDWSKPPELPLPRYFLALHKDKVGQVLTQYKSNLRTNIVSLNDYSEMTTLLQELQAIAPR